MSTGPRDPFVDPQFVEEEPTRPVMPERGNQRVIGSILMREFGVRRDQIEQALAIQREEGGRIGEILVKMRAINESDLLRALGIQLGIPVVPDLKPEEVDVDLATSVPIAFSREHKLLALR